MKETRLDDDAAIYNRRVEKTEKEKWKSLSWKKKLEYFKDYYLKFVIVGLIIVVGIGSFVHSMLTKKEAVFTITLVNGTVDDKVCDDLSTEYGKVLGISPQKEEVMIDKSLYTNGTDSNTLSDVALQKLSVYSYAQGYDILIADQAVVENYASMGYFISLNAVLPDDLLDTYHDALLSVDNNGTSAPYGILVKDVKSLDAMTKDMNTPVLAVLQSTAHSDDVTTILSYLLK